MSSIDLETHNKKFLEYYGIAAACFIALIIIAIGSVFGYINKHSPKPKPRHPQHDHQLHSIETAKND